jgi:hypothetical protein
MFDKPGAPGLICLFIYLNRLQSHPVNVTHRAEPKLAKNQAVSRKIV